jgi:hypothetical protein
LRETYADLFTIKAEPAPGDRKLIEGKFKSAHNASDRIAQLMTNTFYSLLPLADLKHVATKIEPEPKGQLKAEPELPPKNEPPMTHRPTLHYNIQIHLPATKDVEVFNAIFKSLREHLLE